MIEGNAAKKRLEAPHTTRLLIFKNSIESWYVHKNDIIHVQVLWLGRPDSEAMWVSASSLPSSIIKEFEEGICTTGIEQEDGNYGKETYTLGIAKEHINDPKRMHRSRPVVQETTG